MKDARIGALLALSILVMAVTPLLAAYYLLDDALRTSLDLGFNPQIERTLDASADNLRVLRRLDPRQGDAYRAQFEDIQSLRQVYSEADFVKQRIARSLTLYFVGGLAFAVLLSGVLATVLSRRIARSHARNVAELTRVRDTVRYLEQMATWQELARMLAHEIKNPLTPIEVLVSALPRGHSAKSREEFAAQLDETRRVIGEEIHHLQATVNRFSEFARLPRVERVDVDLAELLRSQWRLIEPGDPDDHALRVPDRAPARLDPALFRQVLANLVANGREANPKRKPRFTITLERQPSTWRLVVSNDGAPVPAALAPRIFDPYVSGHSSKDNMGLGLAIVKKIVLEHGGDIRHEERDGHPQFVITLPAERA
jgi:signal transduction histidine kinase